MITPGKIIVFQAYSVYLADLPFSIRSTYLITIVNCKDVKTGSYNGYYGETPISVYVKDGVLYDAGRLTYRVIDQSADIIIAYYATNNWGDISYTV